MPWLLQDPVARWIVAGSLVVMLVGEVAVSIVGHARRRDGAVVQDRRTKWVIGVAVYLAVLAAIEIAKSWPGLRAYADTWWTLGLGVAVVLAGAAFRDWAILSLGRYFRREVTIEPGQQIVRRGPYKLLRHPSYAGMLLALGGLGLALGSWVGAGVAVLILFAGMLPRIRVEEHALARAFGEDYDEYARSTARLLPHVW
jgi:protein-S-isoprenylcysteine O-methyltransferase Ste14